MNSRNIARTTGAFVVVALLFFSFTAFQSAPLQKKNITDTIPTKEKKVRDLDEALIELDKSKMDLELQMKKMDWQKMEKDIQASLKEVNSEKIKAEVEKAMQQVDLMKMKTELDASISKVDMEKIKKEMEKVKEIDMKQIQENIKNIQPQIERSLKDAQQSIEKAKIEIAEYKGFVDNLQKDGLINKKDEYTIEIKNRVLTINGQKQPEAVTNKYRSFLEKHPNETIKKSDDDFTINKN